MEDSDRNPAIAFRKRPATARDCFLSLEEIRRLADVLDADHEQRSAGIIRLCMLTGARVGEVKTAIDNPKNRCSFWYL